MPMQPHSGGVMGLAHRLCASIGEPVLSVLFPPRCAGCGEFETHLCAACRQTMVATGADSCPRCGEPGPQALVGGRCAQCMGKDLEYSGARGAFRHQGVSRDLVAQFKFGGQPVLGKVMAGLAKPAFDEFVDLLGSRDRLLVTWVPVHPSSRRERGYNQAEILSRWLVFGSPSIERASLVRKTRTTRNQKTLDKAGRQQNLRGVFSLEPTAALRIPSHTEAVILVDDVFTTGATAREVSAVLRKGTGLPVYVFTFSRAVAGITERHD